MLNEAKLAMRITASAYDGDIADLLDAAARDLTAAGVVLPGRVSFTRGTSGVTDNSTLKDALCQRALITYARMYFGSPDDYDRLKDAYEAQKVILMHADRYTAYGGDGDGES